jgi:hypothetical protein
MQIENNNRRSSQLHQEGGGRGIPMVYVVCRERKKKGSAQKASPPQRKNRPSTNIKPEISPFLFSRRARGGADKKNAGHPHKEEGESLVGG